MAMFSWRRDSVNESVPIKSVKGAGMMGAFRYVAYRRWYAYVCGCVGAASNVGAGASVNIAPCCAGAPGFAPPVPGNFRYFRFLGGWGSLGLSASMYARKSGAPLPQPVKPTRGRHPAFSSITSVGFIRLRNHRHRRNHRCTSHPAADPANPPAKNPPQTRHPAQP